MKTPFLVFWLTLILAPALSEVHAQGLDHSAWDKLLKKYVSEEGFVDYKGFQKSRSELDDYLSYLGDNEPASADSRYEQLAFYINLYNAATVQLILDKYPLKSIKDIKNPWGRKRIRLGTDSISLNKIEHSILRNMNEPRIHFAINCASISCPKLLNRAFTAAGMELDLQLVTMDFVNDESRNRLTPEEVYLSAIFKWYRGDFMQKRSLISFLQPYTEVRLRETTGISYLPYDWSLNEK